MQKFQDFMIKNCQWFAIGIGVLFVLLVVWKYVLAPVEVKLDATHAASAITVDDEVAKRAAALDAALSQKTPATLPAAALNPEVSWIRQFSGKVPAAAIYSSASFVNNLAPEITEPGEVKINVAEKVKTLPEVPMARPTELRSALATVTVTAPPAAGAAGGAPVMPAAGAPGAAPTIDMAWVKVRYEISQTDITQSFNKVKIPANSFQTAVVGVELWRQEQLPDGTFGTPTRVARLKNSAPLMDVPAANASWDVIRPFMTAVESGSYTTDVMRPSFYPVSFGEDPMQAPRADTVAPVTPAANPVTPAPPVRVPVTPRAGPRGGGGGGAAPVMPRGAGGGGGRGGRGTGLAPTGELRVVITAAPANLQLAQNYPPPTPYGEPGIFPIPGNPEMPGGMPGQGAGISAGQIPNGLFNPSQATAGPGQSTNLEGWLFDETAQQSHTYRYKIRYALRNPVFGAQNVTDPAQPQLNQTYAIWSEPAPVNGTSDTGWSRTITIQSMSKFFLRPWAGSSPSLVQVDVYRWSKGGWQMKNFTVALGDLIGATVSGLDYSTGYTLVDARTEERGGMSKRRSVATLLAPDGTLITRDPQADFTDPMRNQLIPPANQNNPGGLNPGGPNPGGMEPMPMPMPLPAGGAGGGIRPPYQP